MQLIDRCNQIGMNPEHATIIAGFEQAVIRGTKNVFGQESRTQGCFSQSTWRKIQSLGHAHYYTATDDGDFRRF